MAQLLKTNPTTSIGQLIDESLKSGIRFALQDGQLRIGEPQDSDEPVDGLIDVLLEHRDELERLFAPGPGKQVQLGDRCFKYSVWQGEQLQSCFAMDTETELIESPAIVPKLAMVSVSDGKQHFLVHPDDVAKFMRQHADATIVGHNFAGFDFGVLQQHLLGDDEARETLWKMADEGRIKDTMLMDGLYRLARSDAFNLKRGLDIVATCYAGLTIDKADPCRKRYGAIIDQRWHSVPRMFFDYAIGDAIASYFVYEDLLSRMWKVVQEHGVEPKTIEEYGLLSERIQVQGAIGLVAIERNGLQVDRRHMALIREGLEQNRERLVKLLGAEVPGLFKRGSNGTLKLTTSGAPSKNDSVVLSLLESIATEFDLDPPRSEKKNQITKSSDYWQQYDHHPFIGNWISLEEVNKLLSFFTKIDSDVIHPRYNCLVRTGRTSSHSPNIQQLPRDGNVREGIVAPDGYSFYVVDYRSVELRTLAAILLSRYGSSRLAEVIGEGTDPHAYTAAMFEGVTLAEFYELPKNRQKELRQRAKAINFGIPGGLGARSLVAYAKTTYNVTISLEEATQFRNKLITKIYPELFTYLSEDTYSLVARQLGCTVQDVRCHFAEPSHLGCMRRIVRGETTRAGTNEPYPSQRIEAVWSALAELNQNPDLVKAIQNRDASEKTALAGKLFGSPVSTLTGRVRGRVSFTAARNTPFQGLAADGSKLALYRLTRAGYRVVASIHDEFVLEVSDDADWVNEPKRINAIICDAMSFVCNGFPIEVEGARAKRWSKAAEPVFDEQTGELLVWEPGESHTEATRPSAEEPSMTASDNGLRQHVVPPGITIVNDSPRVICGNCVDVGRALLDSGERFDLVFGDPPFNIGHGYATYDDNLPCRDFGQFMHDWLDIGRQLVMPNGLLAMHGPDKLAYIALRHFCDDPLHHINWFYKFGQSCAVQAARRCSNNREHLLLWPCKPGIEDTTFNPPTVQSDRATKYNDKRTQRTATPGLKVAGNVWGVDEQYFGRVQGNNKERWDETHGALIDHPNQLPERYVQRVIETFTNPGDRVLIMFGRSGTETVVAHALGRDVTAIELGESECRSLIKRLDRGPVRLKNESIIETQE